VPDRYQIEGLMVSHKSERCLNLLIVESANGHCTQAQRCGL
jgi:hypothetical protein